MKPPKIFISTLFKSGTKLLEYLVHRATDQKPYIVPMSTPPVYTSADPITFEDDAFFIWHNVMSGEVIKKVKENEAKVILLGRNIYDLTVSQFHHFVDDVDSEIGHGTNATSFLNRFNKAEQMSLIINGVFTNAFTYPGLSASIRQIKSFLDFAKQHECLLIDYDEMVINKAQTFRRIAMFLEMNIEKVDVANVVDNSSLNQMRLDRAKVFGTGKHFRKGEPGNYIEELSAVDYLNITAIINKEFNGIIEQANTAGVGNFFKLDHDEINTFFS